MVLIEMDVIFTMLLTVVVILELADGQMASKSSNRILIIIVVVLVVLLAVAIGVLIWRERNRPKDNRSYSEGNIRTRFPGFFRNVEEQTKFESAYITGFENPRPVQKFVNSSRPCVFQCFNQTQPQLRQRRASSSVYHGCCESFVNFTTPLQLPNLLNRMRNIVQFGLYKQYFLDHVCLSVTPCSGCTCAQENSIHTAVVIRAGVTDPDDIDDVEIDFFRLDGCCRCINT